MKRLLLIFSTLLFLLPSAWADYNITIATSEVEVKGNGGTKTESLGGTATLSKVEVNIRTANKSRTNSFDIGTSSGGTDIYSGAPKNTSYDNIVSSNWGGSTKSTNAIHFKNNTSLSSSAYSRYYKNVKLYIAKADVAFSSILVGNTSTKTFNYFSTSGAPSIGGFTSTESHFTITNVTFASNYCYTVTVKFQPEAIASYSGLIKYNGVEVAQVSGAGSLSAPTGFTNTAVTNTKASFSWNAVTGATGYRLINKTTGSTVDASGTSATMTGLTPLQAIALQLLL